MPIAIDTKTCTGCEVCDDVCPMDVIAMDDIDGKYVAYMKYPDECFHCKACVMDCPSGCITIDFNVMYRGGVPVEMIDTSPLAPLDDIKLRKWRGLEIDIPGKPLVEMTRARQDSKEADEPIAHPTVM